MRQLAIVAALLTLTACSEAEEATEPETAEPAAQTAQADAWPFEAGTYEYERSDGASGVNTLHPDGTYTDVGSDGETGTGKWGVEGDLSCFYATDGSWKTCFTFTKPDAEGNHTGVAEDGRTVKVRKIA